MRILAFAMAALAVSVWWHPLTVAAQFSALLALAVACLAIRSYMKRAQVVQEKFAALEKSLRPLLNTRSLPEDGES